MFLQCTAGVFLACQTHLEISVTQPEQQAAINAMVHKLLAVLAQPNEITPVAHLSGRPAPYILLHGLLHCCFQPGLASLHCALHQRSNTEPHCKAALLRCCFQTGFASLHCAVHRHQKYKTFGKAVLLHCCFQAGLALEVVKTMQGSTAALLPASRPLLGSLRHPALLKLVLEQDGESRASSAADKMS